MASPLHFSPRKKGDAAAPPLQSSSLRWFLASAQLLIQYFGVEIGVEIFLDAFI